MAILTDGLQRRFNRSDIGFILIDALCFKMFERVMTDSLFSSHKVYRFSIGL